MKKSMLPITLLALMSMPGLGDIGNLGELGSPLAPDLEDLKLPDTTDVARRTRELEERQRARFPSRKKRMKAKEKADVVL